MPNKKGLIKRPDSKFWQYYFRYKGKTYRGSTGEIDYEKAQERLYRIQYTVMKKTDIETLGNISIEEFGVEYLKYVAREFRKETLKSYRSVIRGFEKFLNAQYPHIKLLKEVTPDIIEAFKAHKLEVRAKTTVHNNIKCVKTMFKWAVEHNPALLKDNPATAVKNISKKRIREDQKPISVLTIEEFEKFVKYTKKHYLDLYPLYVVYMYTGARKRELFSLEWSDVDFNNRLIRIRYKEGFIPKTDERTIPLHNKLIDILKSIPRKGKYVFMDGKRPYIYPDKKKSKGMYESHKPYRYLGLIMKAIKKPEFTRLHWLRHSFATIIAKEYGIKFAQEVLGHRDIQVTERYIHFDREYLRDNLNKIEVLNRIFK